MTLTYSYDPTTAIGQVRLYTDDRDMTETAAAEPEARSCVFADDEIQIFLTHRGGDVLLAAALALRTIANNRALLVQRRKIGRTDVDFGDVRRDLLKSAEEFEKLAYTVPADAIAEVVYDDFGLRRIIINEQIRQG